VREEGVIQSQAVLIAIGINWEGKREVLGVELANRESQTSWREFLLGLKHRGLCGVEFAVTDDHAGLKKAIAEILPEAAWQRCYVHFLRNALDYLPRKADDDCLQELPANARGAHLPERRQLSEAHAGALCRDSRSLARGQPLHQHGFAARRAQGATQESRLALRPDRPICTT
jgi:transposase-like protein